MKNLSFGVCALILLSSCAIPGGPGQSDPGSSFHRVVLSTPYGDSASRAVSSSGYFQSTILPVNLEQVIAYFEVVLTSEGTLPDRPTATVAFNDASRFVFDDVPAGVWSVRVDAFDSSSRLVARGVYPSAVTVSDSAVATVPATVSVSPVRSAVGGETGNFRLHLWGVPAKANALELEFSEVTVAADGSFALTDRMNQAPLPLTWSPLEEGSISQEVDIQTNSGGIPSGTYLLKVKFLASDLGSWIHTFQPVFTVEIFQNLTSTLDLTLKNQWTGAVTSAPTGVTVTGDVEGNAVVHWSASGGVGYVSHYQIAKTDPSVASSPTLSDVLETIPNLGAVTEWNTAIPLYLQAQGMAKFWVRRISSGLWPSAWASVVGDASAIVVEPKDFYVSAGGSDANNGTQAAPFLTIQKAIDVAQLEGIPGRLNRINIAQGTYTLTDATGPLTVAARDLNSDNIEEPAVPVSFLGGFANDWASRDPSTTVTVIQDTKTSSAPSFLLDHAELGNVPQVVDGLTILHETGTDATAIQADGVAFLTLSRLTISLAVISTNGGVGILLSPRQAAGQKDIRIHSNRITFQSTDESPMMTGIELYTEVDNAGLAVNIFNNVIDVGLSSDGNSTGILDQASSSNLGSQLTIRNNTFITRAAMAGTADSALRFVGSRSAVVQNNLFYELDGFARAISSDQSNTNLLFQNNAFEGFDTNGEAYVSESTFPTSSFVSWFSSSSADNTSLQPGDVEFVNFALGDYRLAGTSHIVSRDGGLNGAAQTPPWSFSTDMDGLPRTGTWSMGAYETDAP